MKTTDKIVIGIISISLPFLFALFFSNYTATSIGIVILGAGITIKFFDTGSRSKAIWYMWIAIILIVCVLLGIQYVIPNIKFR